MKYAQTLNEYFSGNKRLFLIPLYQRRYTWQVKHCERLFSDLEKIHKNGLLRHYFGNIVSVTADNHYDDLLIIDGQQRITTISLLVLAGINAVKNGDMQCGFSGNPDVYLEDQKNIYLMAKYREGDRQIKLRPIESDMKAYDVLFANDSNEFVSAKDSGITANYLLFYNRIKSSSMTFQNLIDAIERLSIIDIRLDTDDEPQLIFESLNSCGKDLEESDKVRNYLLMSMGNNEQEKCYKNFWHKIETYTDDEPTMFIRDYMTLKTKSICKIEELYFEFKSFHEFSRLSREDLLSDMLKYANYYYQIQKGATKYSSKVNFKLQHLANLGSWVAMPYSMAFLDYAETNNLSENEIYEVFDVIENYWARRIVCEYPSNSLAKVFALLHADIIKIIDAHKRRVDEAVSYVEVFKYVLLKKKQGNSSFPTDAEVEEDFPKRKIYKLVADQRNFLLERLENRNSKEANETYFKRMSLSNKEDNHITIEHIMPQTLSPQWKNELGVNWASIFEQYLHTFANLTLTGYNSEYGNRPFKEKKEGFYSEGEFVTGFNESPFHLSSYLKNCDRWTLTEIKERERILLNEFLTLWPLPTSTYVPLPKETDLVSLDDEDTTLTNRKICAFQYKGERHEVNVWKEALEQICSLVYRDNPDGFMYLATKEDWVYSKTNARRSKIADNCYVYSSGETKLKRSCLVYIFNSLNIPLADLYFELEPDNSEDE